MDKIAVFREQYVVVANSVSQHYRIRSTWIEQLRRQGADSPAFSLQKLPDGIREVFVAEELATRLNRLVPN